MNDYNDSITDQQLAKLQELFPEVFTEGRVNWPQLRATLGDAIDGGDSYGLSWKGKSGVFAKIQEKTVKTLRPDRDNSVDWDATGNMFIEGDNLTALKILHKSYFVRMFLQRFFELDLGERRGLFHFLEDTLDTNHTVDKYDHDYGDTFPSGTRIFKEE